jgi:hypothetical protein
MADLRSQALRQGAAERRASVWRDHNGYLVVNYDRIGVKFILERVARANTLCVLTCFNNMGQ